MGTVFDSPSGAEVLRLQSLIALRRGVPESVVDYSFHATSRRFGAWLDVPLASSNATRMRSYFESVARRRTISSRDVELQSQRQRYVLVSLAEDLHGAGFGRDRLLRELGDVYGSSVPDSQIAEVVDFVELACA